MLTEEQKIILDIMRLAYLVQELTEYCVFIRYSGHVDQLQIQICKSKIGWEETVMESEFATAYKSWRDKDEDPMKAELLSRREVLEQILEDGSIDYDQEGVDFEEYAVRDYHF